MNYTLIAVTACVSLFVAMPLVSSLCYQIAHHRRRKEGITAEVSGAIIGAIYALLGLLIAFSFSGAHTRLDIRRQLLVQEANAIGTAYLRLELLPVSAQNQLRKQFIEYAGSRAILYEKMTDRRAAMEELARANTLQKEIWDLAVASSRGPEYQSVRLLLLPALNEMFDIVNTRTVAIQTHPPLLIFATLFAVALACAGLTGYRAGITGQAGYFYNLLLAAIIASVLYVILDAEYPRYGLIRLDTVNEVLVELWQTMK